MGNGNVRATATRNTTCGRAGGWKGCLRSGGGSQPLDAATEGIAFKPIHFLVGAVTKPLAPTAPAGSFVAGHCANAVVRARRCFGCFRHGDWLRSRTPPAHPANAARPNNTNNAKKITDNAKRVPIMRIRVRILQKRESITMRIRLPIMGLGYRLPTDSGSLRLCKGH